MRLLGFRVCCVRLFAQGLLTALSDVLLGDPQASALVVSMQGAPLHRRVLGALRAHPITQGRPRTVCRAYRGPTERSSGCQKGPLEDYIGGGAPSKSCIVRRLSSAVTADAEAEVFGLSAFLRFHRSAKASFFLLWLASGWPAVAP